MSDTPETEAKRCSKCDSDDVLFVEAVRGGYGSGNVIPLGGITIWSSVKVNRFICMTCGFCEEWISSHADREALRRAYGPESRREQQKARRRDMIESLNRTCRRFGQFVGRLFSRIIGVSSATARPHDEGPS
ncbi:MAG: hypothetical protein U0941_14525 [Planctomycetaceae bacterium]